MSVTIPKGETIMKKFAVAGILLALVAGLTVTSAQAQDAKGLLDKMIQAQGGRAAMAAVKDQTITGSLEMVQMGMNGSVTMYQKEPDKMRIDIEIMGMIITQAFDGQKAWMTNPQTGSTEEMPETQGQSMRRQALGSDSVLNPEKYGITYELKAKEKIGDKEYFVLEQTYKDGTKATIYIDPGTYLVYKAKAKTQDMTGADVEGETVFDDYKKEGDLMVAHKMITYQGGAEFIRMTFTKVTYNTKLEDAFFMMSK
jgi:outer membrane lipoprotein-sorting protein